MELEIKNKDNKTGENAGKNNTETVWDGELSGVGVSSKSKQFFVNRIAREQRQTKTSLEEGKWLTTREAAQYLRVSVSSIKMMIYRGTLRAHKLGRRNRYLRDELDRLITLPSSN